MNGLSPALLAMSWERCHSYGLEAGQQVPGDPCPIVTLSNQLEENRQLLVHAQPVMDVLYEQIAKTESVVILASDAGLILHSRGDADFLKRTERVALTPGVEWSEHNRGTNAIGTSIAVGAPVIVHGKQHFLSANKFLTCSASPIYDPFFRLTGILDITGDQKSFNHHTMALVRMSVQMIEKRMFASAFSDAVILRFHACPEFLGTLCEGMMAFAEDGALVSANRNACFQFSQTLNQLIGASFSSLFGLPLRQVFDHLLVRPDDPMVLTLNSGVRVYASVDVRPASLRRFTRIPFSSAKFVQSSQLAHEVEPSSSQIKDACPLERLKTGDPQVEAVVNKVRKVIGRDIPILIQGETGTGKELLATAIHRASLRASKPFVAVNCAAIPEGLIESELFGYEDGAFTGARRKGSVGRILQANGGTLFLDEIGDMPISLQARLLRVLQERVVVPLGSLKSYPVDIAVICATHRRIRELVSAGQFREDLYFRLNGLTVMLPPLRQRSDREQLIAAMLREFSGDKPSPKLDPQVLTLFHRHPWSGNLRQLSNLLRTALVMAEGEAMIRYEHLPDDFIEDAGCVSGHQPAGQNPVPSVQATIPPESGPAPGRLQDYALQAIRDALARHDGNISAAARELGISRNTLYRRLQQ